MNNNINIPWVISIRNVILRGTFSLVILLIITFSSIMWQMNQNKLAVTLSNNYHLQSSSLYSDAMEKSRLIENVILTKYLPESTQLFRDKFFDIHTVVQKISQDLSAIIDLQNEFGNEQLEAITSLISKKFRLFQQSINKFDAMDISLNSKNMLAPIIINMQQAITLHNNLRAELIVQSKLNDKRFYQKLILLLSIVALTIIYIILTFIKAINKITNDKAELDKIRDRYSHELESEVESRTKLLIQAKKNAEKASKMASLGELASGMAHEINSPILEVNLIADRIIRRAKKGKPDNIPLAMLNIKKSVCHVSELIENLLKLSRGSPDDKFEKEPIKNIIENVINLSKERFALNSILLKVEYQNQSSNSIIFCQKLQISQVLINLLNNAFDAIELQNEKWINIFVSETKLKTIIVVEDSGNGVPKNIQNKIFAPMFTSKKVGKGTGLGLSICASIVEKHHGELFYDTEAKHSSFVLRLPKTTSIVDK